MNTATRELKDSWLVQRLTRPRQGRGLLGPDNPFAFGGGFRNGGLSDQAMGLLRSVWSFDYMGSAEFELGAVPEALSRLAKADLSRFSLAVPLAEVPANWRDKGAAKPEGEATIYGIAPRELADAVAERVGVWVREEHLHLKEGLRLTSALRPIEKWDREVCGWLELDNGFLFFTDAEMWEQASNLFQVPA